MGDASDGVQSFVTTLDEVRRVDARARASSRTRVSEIQSRG